MRSVSVPRMWASALGGEVLYEVDLPGCCRHDAHYFEVVFECAGCGAAWQPVEQVSPEACGFIVEGDNAEDERGAA